MQALPALLAGLEQGRCRNSAAVISGNEQLLQRISLQRTLEGHTGCVNTVHFSPCGEFLVSGSDDQTIKFWRWQQGEATLSYDSGHDDNVFQARIMPESCNSTVVSCAADGQVRVGHVPQAGGAVRTRRLAEHRGRAHKLAVEHGSPHCFFSCGEDGVVKHFDLRESAAAGRSLLVCRAFMGRTLELHSVAANPAAPTQFCVGGSDEYCRIYDLRRPSASISTSSGTVVAEPLRRLAPGHLRRSGVARRSSVHITSAVFNRFGDILCSYNDENIYLLAGERPRVCCSKGQRQRRSGNKRMRSGDASERKGAAARWAPEAGLHGAAAWEGRAGGGRWRQGTTAAGSDGEWLPGADAGDVQQESEDAERLQDDGAHPALVDCEHGAVGGGSGPPVERAEPQFRAGPALRHTGPTAGDAGEDRRPGTSDVKECDRPPDSSSGDEQDGSQEHEAEWHTDSSDGVMDRDYDSDGGSRGGGSMSDVDSVPLLGPDGSHSDDSGRDVGGPWPPDSDPVLQCFNGHRNAQTVKGVSFMGVTDEWVVSGSDCGHVFIWSAATGKLCCVRKGDSCVVNCLEPHPTHLLTLATSGIDDDIKLWAPTGERWVLGAEAELCVQRNLRQQGSALPHPFLMQNVPAIFEQLFHMGSDGDGGEEDEEEEEEEEEDEDLGGGRDGPPRPECSVQ